MRTLWEVGLEKEGDSCQLGVEEAAEGAKGTRAWGLPRESLHGWVRKWRGGGGQSRDPRSEAAETAWGSPCRAPRQA